eukprot:768261-Hanusia_phi.AAC.2
MQDLPIRPAGVLSIAPDMLQLLAPPCLSRRAPVGGSSCSPSCSKPSATKKTNSLESCNQEVPEASDHECGVGVQLPASAALAASLRQPGAAKTKVTHLHFPCFRIISAFCSDACFNI